MTNLDLPAFEGVRYELLDHDIHFVCAVQSTGQAVNDLFVVLEKLYQTTPDSGVVSMLVDSINASMPMTPAIRVAGELEKKYPNHIPVNVALLQRHPLANILQIMLRPLRLKNQIRLFDAPNRDEAIQWLIDKQAEARMKHSSAIHAG